MNQLSLVVFLLCFAITSKAQNWLLTGNSGTNTATNFLGTTDSKALFFRTNNIERGRIQTNGIWKFGFGVNNASIDTAGVLKFNGRGMYQVGDMKYVFQSETHPNYGLFFHTDVAGNVFHTGAASDFNFYPRYDFLDSNGIAGVAIVADNGLLSARTIATHDLICDGGFYNFFVSPEERILSVANGNIFVGRYSGFSITTGSYNIGIGTDALRENTSGHTNIAIGENALYDNTGGINNLAIGSSALANNINGSNNTAIGISALYANTSASNNTATGYLSLNTNTSGYSNTAFGKSALSTNTTGNRNTAIGDSADVSGNNLNNATAIGYNARVSASNAMMFGNASLNDWSFGNSKIIAGYALTVGTTSANGNGARLTEGGVWTNTSDKDLKEDFQIQNPNQILEKVKSLPITRWKYKGANNEYHIGPVAQDFYRIFNVGMDDKTISTVDPSGVALLAIQALSKQNDELKSEIAELKSMMLQLQQNFNSCNACAQQISNINPQSTSADGASLAQNMPNPFTHNTSIGYTLPQKFTTAQIVITDKTGKTLKLVNVSGSGKGKVNVEASVMTSGAYNYSLLVDGKLVGTKQMILAK